MNFINRYLRIAPNEPGREALPSVARHNLTAIVIHWVLAIAIVVVFAAGHYMTSIPFSPLRLQLYNWHKWTGFSLLILSIVRLAWRLARRPPALPRTIADAMPNWQHRLHSVTHTALYALFFAVPLLGWAYSSAVGFPIVVFGMFPLPDFVPADKALAALIKPWHQVSAYALIALASIHAAAALKHQFIDRDGLIGRMWPSRT